MNRNTKLVTVLGCGPAGMLAAHAAIQNHNFVTIISDRTEPSRIGGAQFLHRAIPGITSDDPDGVVEFKRMGDDRGYAEKVYGHPEAATSWWSYDEGEHPVWSMQDAYDKLWDLYGNLVVEQSVTWDLVPTIPGDIVVSCIPAPVVCPHRDVVGEPTCLFTSQDVWINQVEGKFIEPMTIIYSGHPEQPWYRASNIFDNASFEYSFDPAPRSAVKIKKPLVTDCPGPERIKFYRLGRYGQWQKDRLIHHAYEGALGVTK